jgi:membrane associated rhomboid family serine protease
MHYLLLIVVILYTVFIVTRVFPFILALGIWPRKPYGLPGIFFAPFLHVNFNHLFFNTVPLVILSNFLLINGLHYFLMVTLSITLISGLCIWCFAKPGIHLGSSAVVTGYWGLLVTNIYLQGTLMAVMLGIVCFYYFAGIFLGVFPGKKGVSWEGHLFGLLAGIGTSYLVVM